MSLNMMNPFELVFTNIMFFYPAFRSEDAAGNNDSRFRKTLTEAAAGGALGKRGLMIYVHIPFCRHICRFCGYHRKKLTSPEALSAYVDRLLVEIRQWSSVLDGPRRQISHLYIGGGTPTLLSARDLRRLVAALHKAFAISDETEFDMESDMTPLLDPRNLKRYRTAGIKRISVGVQSFDSKVRKMAAIGAGLEKDALDKGIDCLRQAGFGINYDLMFGLPGQSTDSFLNDIQKSALDVAADHVDLLEFFPQPEAYFTRHFEQYRDQTADRETRKKMYGEARTFLLQNGYAQHTITDFWRKPLTPSPFKTMLYRNADIIGLGAGSHGILADAAYRNARLDEGYLKESGTALPLAFIRFLPPSLLRTRSLVLLPKLLTFAATDFPGGITKKERAILQSFVEQGRLTRKKDVYGMTEAGLLSSAEMMLDVLRTEEEA